MCKDTHVQIKCSYCLFKQDVLKYCDKKRIIAYKDITLVYT